MVEVNMSAPVGGNEPEGTYLGNVSKAEEFTSRSGHPGLKLEFGCVHEGATFTVRDTIMLGGGGWGMGRARLTALGVPEDFTGNLDPLDLVGRQVYIHLTHEEYTGRGGETRKNLKPNPGKGSHSGYSPEGSEAAKAECVGGAVDDGAPF